MKRIATANRAVDLFAAGKDGFRAAVPGVSDATYLSALWFNHIQEAVIRTIEQAGLALSDTDFNQFVTALNTTYARLGTLSAFTVSPTMPTAAGGDNTTKGATTAFVQGSVNGRLSRSVAGGVSVALTADEADNGILELTGALTANIAVSVPAVSGVWVVANKTTGPFTLTLKTPAGTGVLVSQGFRTLLYCDGTNVVDAISDFLDLALTGAPTAPTPAQFDNTTKLATMAAVRNELLGLGNSVYNAVFGATIAATGSQLLPSGYIRKWGQVVLTTAGVSVPVTFAAAFPNACYGAVMTPVSAASAPWNLNGTPTAAGFNASQSFTGGTTTYNWEAWGK